MDVAAWLRGLELEQYAPAFRDNDVDAEVLPELTAGDLISIGVTSVGHRRKLLAAIAALRAEPRPDLAQSADGPRSPSVSLLISDAERRQLTVMFCDLAGSTALSARLDPEDLREVIAAYHRCVGAVAERFGGFAAKYMGDGVLIYFGYPEAREDDVERAVLAGLDLVAEVPRLAGAELACRVGIATGLVVVGELAGAAQEVVGETPNLAARLQNLADPNTVLIDAATRRLVGNLFDCRSLGDVEIRGFESGQQVWQTTGRSRVHSRFEALRSGGTPLVGRDAEFALLRDRWREAAAGHGQVVLLPGEAGIGKSRLTVALLESLAGDPHTRLRYFCSPQHTDGAFHPIISQVERAVGLAHDDNPQTKLDKLDAVLAQTSTSSEDAALFAEMLSLPNDGRYPALKLTPEQRRERTLEAMMSQLSGLAGRQPVLMIFEDVHWIDPTSREVLGRIIERIETLPVLLIITFRPEFNPPWAGQPHQTSLTLNRLAEREAAAIIAGLAGDQALPADVSAEIVARTDGIPLFIEEMTKAVLEAESEGTARRMFAAVPSPALAVPASLHASLMARLDRLGAAKEVAQIGSAIGREFPHALLALVARKSEAELGAALDRLVQVGLLSRHGVPPQANYLFEHALVQDAAYGTLLREPRRGLHARIAETLETRFAETVENQPEILAHHCTEAQLIEKAAGLWGKAGQRSVARSALVEAIAQLTRALDQIATLPGTPAMRREQIKLQVALINPLMHVKGHAAAETRAAAERARLLIEQAEALGEPPEDPLVLFRVLNAFWVANLIAFNGDALRDLAAQYLVLAEKQKATGPLMSGHRMMGISLLHTGDIAEALEHLDKALPPDDPGEHRPPAEGAVLVLSHRSLALWALGYPEAALRDAGEALRTARELAQAGPLMGALANATVSHSLCRNWASAAAQAEELVVLAEEKGALLWKGFGMSLQGGVLAATGRASEATEIMISAMAALRKTGATPGPSYSLAHAYAELGQFEAAWRCIGEAMTAAETTRDTWFEAEIHRTAGDIALMSPEPDAAIAQAHFERAIAIARAQRAKSWELRAATSLARLWRDQGEPQQARDLLAPIYGWFTEGYDTLDLKEAKALLDELTDPALAVEG